MVSIEKARHIALSFPETEEHPHFDRKAFRVKKKTFATLLEKDKTMNLKLSLADQSVFCVFDSKIIYPVPGGWGRMGYSTVNLSKVKMAMFIDAITSAYCNAAPKKWAEKYFRG